MSAMAPVHSVNEANKPASERVHHNNNACGAYKAIPARDRVSGTGGYRLCRDCQRENQLGH